MTLEKLNKMDACKGLLDPPASEVVGELIAEIRRLREVVDYFAQHSTWADQRKKALRALEEK